MSQKINNPRSVSERRTLRKDWILLLLNVATFAAAMAIGAIYALRSTEYAAVVAMGLVMLLTSVNVVTTWRRIRAGRK